MATVAIRNAAVLLSLSTGIAGIGGLACAAPAAAPPAPAQVDGEVAAAASPTPLRPRAAHTATALSDGRVLIVGGCAADGCGEADRHPTTEFYLQGRGFVAGPPLGEPRLGHTATLLEDGRVLIVGGWAREGTPPLASAELFDPSSNTFTPIGPLAEGRGGHAAARLTDGRVLVLGGWVAGRRASDSVEIFDPTTRRFGPAAPLPGPRLGPLAATLADGTVLVVGGEDLARTPPAGAVRYDPATDRWRAAGTVATPRFKAALAPMPDGSLLLLGGTVDDRKLLATSERFDPATDRFAPGPAMETERYKFTTARVDGRLVAVGGRQAAVLAGDRFVPLPSTVGVWRSFATATPLPGGDLLIVGGYDERIAVHPDALLVPAAELAAAAP